MQTGMNPRRFISRGSLLLAIAAMTACATPPQAMSFASASQPRSRTLGEKIWGGLVGLGSSTLHSAGVETSHREGPGGS